jgi:hypothetical protein
VETVLSRKIYSTDYHSKNNDVLRKSIVVIEVDHEINNQHKEMFPEEYKSFITRLEKAVGGEFIHKVF